MQVRARRSVRAPSSRVRADSGARRRAHLGPADTWTAWRVTSPRVSSAMISSRCRPVLAWSSLLDTFAGDTTLALKDLAQRERTGLPAALIWRAN